MPLKWDVESISFEAGSFGDRWDRGWYAFNLGGASHADTIAEIFALLPNTGTPAPAPYTFLTVSDALITRIENQDATPGLFHGWGTLTYTTPSRTALPADPNGAGISTVAGAGLINVPQYYDIFGNNLITEHDNVQQAHEGQVFKVLPSFSHTRPETINAITRNVTYGGKLNFGLWNGFATRTVLCKGVTGYQENNQDWVNTYQFEFRPDGWDQVFVHDDPFFPGSPLPNPALGTPAAPSERVVYELLDDIDFGPLNISL